MRDVDTPPPTPTASPATTPMPTPTPVGRLRRTERRHRLRRPGTQRRDRRRRDRRRRHRLVTQGAPQRPRERPGVAVARGGAGRRRRARRQRPPGRFTPGLVLAVVRGRRTDRRSSASRGCAGGVDEPARARASWSLAGRDHRARHRQPGVSGARAALRAQRPDRAVAGRTCRSAGCSSRSSSPAAIAIATTTLASHTGDHAFLVLPAGIPVIGGTLTIEAALFGLSTGIGIAAAVLAAAPLSLVLEPHALVDALPARARAHRRGDRHGAQPHPGHRAQRHRDSRRAAHARLALAARSRVAGSRGAGRADGARGLDHARRGDGGARLRIGRANALQRAGVAPRTMCVVAVVAAAGGGAVRRAAASTGVISRLVSVPRRDAGPTVERRRRALLPCARRSRSWCGGDDRDGDRCARPDSRTGTRTPGSPRSTASTSTIGRRHHARRGGVRVGQVVAAPRLQRARPPLPRRHGQRRCDGVRARRHHHADARPRHAGRIRLSGPRAAVGLPERGARRRVRAREHRHAAGG